jgi:hypothetical protein
MVHVCVHLTNACTPVCLYAHFHFKCCFLAASQGPKPWHPASPALKDAAKQCAQLAAAAGVSRPRLAVKAALQQAGSGVAVHLMGEW